MPINVSITLVIDLVKLIKRISITPYPGKLRLLHSAKDSTHSKWSSRVLREFHWSSFFCSILFCGLDISKHAPLPVTSLCAQHQRGIFALYVALPSPCLSILIQKSSANLNGWKYGAPYNRPLYPILQFSKPWSSTNFILNNKKKKFSVRFYSLFKVLSCDESTSCRGCPSHVSICS